MASVSIKYGVLKFVAKAKQFFIKQLKITEKTPKFLANNFFWERTTCHCAKLLRISVVPLHELWVQLSHHQCEP